MNLTDADTELLELLLEVGDTAARMAREHGPLPFPPFDHAAAEMREAIQRELQRRRVLVLGRRP